jgi:predicted SAM-dependent methyltransferase
MTKLNIGCGNRFSKGWLNIDFHSSDPHVTRVNILRKLPYPEGSFDSVYSSHVLEHFSRETAGRLLREMHRILKPNGIVRVVVPDLEQTCREYLRVLDHLADSPGARKQYDWVILELLDQLTRTRPSGLMEPYMKQLMSENDQEMLGYVQARTQNTPLPKFERQTTEEKLRGITPAKIITKLIYVYVGMVKRLLPSSLRETIVDDSRIGEKHRWMYDRHGMTLLLQECGFTDLQFLSATESQIPGFTEDHLDTLEDGRPYKNVSLYCEARQA